MDSAEVLRYGATEMQVCVPEDWTNEQVQAFAERENPSGVGWLVREFGDPRAEGEPERTDCPEDFGWVHVTLDV